MIAEGLGTVAACCRHITEPARCALSREERGRAARLAAEVSGERDPAAGLRNLARTAPRARAADSVPAAPPA